MRRIAVVGCSGSGKTTLSRRVARSLGLRHIELDGIFHQPGWVPLPVPEFRQRLSAQLEEASGGWITDGNYNSAVGDLIQERADTIVWLDLSRPLVMRRIVLRTLRRFLTREVLWNGNREPLSNFWRWDPERNVIRWAWTSHPRNRERYEQCAADGSWAHARVVRLRTPDEVARFERDCAAAQSWPAFLT